MIAFATQLVDGLQVGLHRLRACKHYERNPALRIRLTNAQFGVLIDTFSVVKDNG